MNEARLRVENAHEEESGARGLHDAADDEPHHDEDVGGAAERVTTAAPRAVVVATLPHRHPRTDHGREQPGALVAELRRDRCERADAVRNEHHDEPARHQAGARLVLDVVAGRHGIPVSPRRTHGPIRRRHRLVLRILLLRVLLLRILLLRIGGHLLVLRVLRGRLSLRRRLRRRKDPDVLHRLGRRCAARKEHRHEQDRAADGKHSHLRHRSLLGIEYRGASETAQAVHCPGLLGSSRMPSRIAFTSAPTTSARLVR